MAPQPDWLEKDFYKVLGISESATAKDVTRAYRKLARELHPDANPGDAAAEERFKEISAAYDVVGDDAKRKEYDEVRKMGPIGGMNFGNRGGQPGGVNFNADDLGDLSSVFGNLFNQRAGAKRGGAARGPGPSAAPISRPRSPWTSATPSPASPPPCTSRATPRARPAAAAVRSRAAPRPCAPTAGAAVWSTRTRASSPSAGRARRAAARACSCSTRAPTARAPASCGVPATSRCASPPASRTTRPSSSKGRGGPGRNGGPAGDLYVLVHVVADKLFGREGHNLTLTVPVTFPEAALGTKLTVPTVDGDNVTLKLPAGTSSGRVFRVKGRGIEFGKKGRGDLLVTVEVAVPAKLTKEQRAAVEAFESASDESPRTHLGV